MKKSKFTETQIVKALKEHEGGRSAEDICRDLGISRPTFYNWKSKYGGMESSDVKRLKELEEAHSRLKRMYAELSMDHNILKDVIAKKGWGPAGQRELTEEIVATYEISASRACKLTNLSRSGYYYRSVKDDQEAIEALQALANRYPAYGFRKLFALLRRNGKKWNHKKIYRLYRLLKLNKRRKGKRRLPSRVKQPLQQQEGINQSWSMDFMSDSLVCGRKFRTFNVIDDCSREVLAIEIDTSLPAPRIMRTLDRILEERGKPGQIRVDNGPEFTCSLFEGWCADKGISLQYIQPGRPMQNGFIERFNGTYRREILDAYVFFELYEVRKLTEEWIQLYNHQRPHEALDNKTPVEWRKQALSNNSSAVFSFQGLQGL
ncbi:MAG TPA: IS3 family transposase [Chitinophagaceae bacterium]|nr:IS3 family transposase [Chitinophagaceae bacterium]